MTDRTTGESSGQKSSVDQEVHGGSLACLDPSWRRLEVVPKMRKATWDGF